MKLMNFKHSVRIKGWFHILKVKSYVLCVLPSHDVSLWDGLELWAIALMQDSILWEEAAFKSSGSRLWCHSWTQVQHVVYFNCTCSTSVCGHKSNEHEINPENNCEISSGSGSTFSFVSLLHFVLSAASCVFLCVSDWFHVCLVMCMCSLSLSRPCTSCVWPLVLLNSAWDCLLCFWPLLPLTWRPCFLDFNCVCVPHFLDLVAHI